MIKEGKLVTNADDVIEELPIPVAPPSPKPNSPKTRQRNLLIAASRTCSGLKIYSALSSDEPRPIDDILENNGLNSSDVLATLFGSGDEGVRPSASGKPFSDVLL